MKNNIPSRPHRAEDPIVAQPFSLQAEQAVVGALLFDPAVLMDELSEKLSGDHFYDPFCRAVYKRAMAMARANETVDAVVLASRLDGYIPDMSEAQIQEGLKQIYMAYPTRQNLQGWATIVRERWVERQLSKMGDRILGLAHVQNVSMHDKLAEAHTLLANVGTMMANDDVVTSEEMVAETLAEIETNVGQGGRVCGVPTGFPEIDEMTTGLRAGELIILAARPSMGKTSLALSLAKHITFDAPLEERKPVLMFSLEMGTTQIGARWLSTNYDVPLQNLRTGTLSPSQYNRLQGAIDDSSDSKFLMDKSGKLNLEELSAKARRKHRETPLGMIIIDYLQLISDTGHSNSSKSERVGDISRGLKQLARSLDVPVIALSQLNRALETRQDKRPVMSDLRDSGAIEQDADIIMFLYRDVIYNKNTPNPTEAELIFAKQRNGPIGTVKLQFEGSTTRFYSPSERVRLAQIA